MENEKMTKCDNCDKLIEQSKMLLHERFCKLNIKKCTICKSPVLIEEYEDHMDENHQEIECEFCKKMFSNADIEAHKRQCDCQLIYCMYCEMQVPKREKKEHEYICGAKTEECMICKQFIQIKDMKAHKIKGCKPPEVVVKPTVEQRKQIVDKRDKEKGVENKIRNGYYNKENEVVRNITNNNVKHGSINGGSHQKKNEVGMIGRYNNTNNVIISKGDKSGSSIKPSYIVGNNVNNNNSNNVNNKNQIRVEDNKPNYSNANSKVTQKPQPNITSSQINITSSSSFKGKPAFVQGKGMKFSNGFNTNSINNNNNNTNKPTPIINNSRTPVKQQQQQTRVQQKPAQPQKQQTLQTKNSMKFVPTITKGQMNKSILSQKPQQQDQQLRKNTKLPSSKQPFNISHFDSGDYLPDDIDYKDLGIPYNNDPMYNQMSLEERNIQEIIARSMKQK